MTNSSTDAATDEVVVVTGIGGIALACARRLARGRQLVLASYHEGRLAQAADLLRSEGYAVHDVVTDVSDPDHVAGLAKRAADLGRLAAVVHTAGVSPVQAPLDRIITVDVLGTAYVLDAFLEYAVAGTVVVCISSSAAAMATLPPELERALALSPTSELAGLPVFTSGSLESGAAYAIAKRANQLRAQSASVPYGRRGARVVSLSPGVVCTRMGRAELDGPSGDRMKALIAASGTGRVGTSDDIAGVVEFVTTPAACFITGTDLLVDGGAIAAARMALPTGQ
jgi:NAD(P)-dependent dehydrogenase (short-subunit alcohol dehydrogenase family)